jgi:hypothetical protein
MHHRFIIMWNRLGLQYVADLTRIEGERVWSRITGANDKWNPSLLNLRTIAMGYQRDHYEIYEFLADEGITEEQIVTMFEQSPQSAADMIRQLGECLYTDRPSMPALIT